MPRHTIVVGAASLFAPVLSGALLYYALRNTHPRTANYANVMSFVGFGIGTIFTDYIVEYSSVAVAMAGLGMLLATLAVRLVRATTPETEPTRA